MRCKTISACPIVAKSLAMDGIARIGLGTAGHDNGERATQPCIDDGYANP
jgi:hypothetical protein